MLNRQSFYIAIRPLFGSRITQSQVEGIEFILNEWDDSKLTDLRWLAYMLATTKHETANTMQPIQEYGGDKYFIKMYWTNQKKAKELGNRSAQEAIDYSGKGLVQITGRYNYIKMGKILGLPLAESPKLAMKMDVAVKIMFEGMTTGKSFAGDFTGKHLGNYFNKTTEDWIGARFIINGQDRANLIAGYGKSFYKALLQ